MKILNKLYFNLIFLLLPFITFSQVSTNEQPPSFQNINILKSQPTKVYK